MTCIKSVVEANDAQLIAVHKEFSKWKKDSSFARITSDYCLALRHFSKKGRSITEYCGTFNSKQSYARSIVTTQVIDGKVYWQLRDNIGWKQAHRPPPAATSNGLPTKVFYNYNRDDVYR